MDFEKEVVLMGHGLSPGFMAAPRQFVSGSGSRIVSSEGVEFIDFCAGTATNMLGHCHAELNNRMSSAIKGLWNVHDYSTPDRTVALQSISEISGGLVECFHFYSGGSETIEAAIRAARCHVGPRRSKILSFKGSYFGKTLGVRQVTNWLFPGELSHNETVDFPDAFLCKELDQRRRREARCLTEIERFFQRGDVGIFVCEPILGSGGSLEASKDFWFKFQKLVRSYEVLLIVDEIYCGLGRAGEDFYCKSAGLQPDLLAFAKGLGNGFPVMVLGGSKEVMENPCFSSKGSSSTTFGGNPLALAAVRSVLEIYRAECIIDNVRNRARELSEFLEQRANSHEPIVGYRSRGLMSGIFIENRELALKLHERCVANGLFLMTFDEVLRFSPALNISKTDLERGLERFEQALSEVR